MSFRWRISLFIILALFIALLVQFVLGFILFRQALLNDLATDLGQFSYLIEQNLLETAQGLTLSQEGLAAIAPYSSYASGRGQVLNLQGHPVVLIGGLFPEATREWMIQKTLLDNGYTLETAMSYQLHNTALRDYLGVSGFALPLLILLFSIAGLWLSLQLLRPLRELQTTVEAVTTSGDLKARVSTLQKDELGRLAQSYNAMMGRLENFFERERAFTRYASHELRNPLTALRVQVEAALSGDMPAAQVLPVLERELKRLSMILDSLLILSRDQLKPTADLDIAEIAQESLERVHGLKKEKSFDIVYAGPEHLHFNGDKVLLGRLIDNLLENAVKYTQAGRIELSLKEESMQVVLKVTDQGEGVPPETLLKLTAPFFRVEKQGAGVGLGLSVVQHIVRAHSGTLEFENLKPVGFAVTVTLPRGEI